MQITDPVADMLTRIRNASTAKHETVDVPASNLKKAIAQILLEEGYIKSYSLVDNGNQGMSSSVGRGLAPAVTRPQATSVIARPRGRGGQFAPTLLRIVTARHATRYRHLFP